MMITNSVSNKTYSKLAIAGAAFLLSASPVFADYGCNGQYGSGNCSTPQDLSLNKSVYNPISKVYFENLGATDATFAPGSTVQYRLQIKNGSGETFREVTVKDTLPPYLTFEAGPGTYDAANKTLTFVEKDMIAGSTREVEILAKVVASKDLPNQNMFCVTNTAQASSTGRSVEDQAQMCISKSGKVGTSTLPVAGFNDLLLLVPFASVGLGGLTLLKKKK